MSAAEDSERQFAIRESQGPAEVVLKARRAQPFFGRHPWVFAGAVHHVNAGSEQPLQAGSIVRLISAEGHFVAWGLYNPHSRIVVRLYSWDVQQPLDAAFWLARVQQAVQLRRGLFDLQAADCGCRLIFSESDRLSGLTVDQYGGCLLVQFTSLALYQHRQSILQALQAECRPTGIWLRTEKGMREAEGLEVVDGLLTGVEPASPLFISEHGLQFGVDVRYGQKTGCYLDQRDNRAAVARYAAGASVLDAFCFSGGFGIAAAKLGGAKSVVGIDSSEAALLLARENARLNGVAERCEYLNEDVRTALEGFVDVGRQFDLVILDPPRMARARSGIDRALNGYLRFNELGVRVVRPGGILVTCSCSGLVTRAEFMEVISETARQSGRDIQILEQHGQPPDHPISATCPESEYLKVVICRVV
ncbi:MAG TPA: class I SAM-dependent rRNA methyltransferase [Planctomycetaceae bacterium]|jgi:23S rRNA (cytosine1962-C5)-methyltransferase|nr:class I SAM-dependent rRNA methyltransferase [Planctomycetaceae bacterium]